MKRNVLTVTVAASLALGLTACTVPSDSEPASSASPASGATAVDPGAVSPALEGYDADVVEQLWEREELTPRDRSLVTVAQLIAANQNAELEVYLERALDDGVTPSELSETITHLAFYSGWQNAMAAVPILTEVFESRGVDSSELPARDPELLPLNEEAESARAAQVQADFGDVAPGVVENTADVLFRDLWLRPDLAPRDRSLITVVALISAGQVAQIPYHLNRAVDNGLTADEVSEVLNHLAFYAGWPRVFSAMPVVRDALAARPAG